MSEASCRIDLPSVHIPTVVSQEVKAICVSREALVRMRTLLVNRVRSYLRSRIGPRVRATPDTLPAKVRRALLDDPEGLPAHLERVLVVLETLREQIAQADTELKLLAREDVRMRRLMTVPGVGPVTAAIRGGAGRCRPISQCRQRRLLSGPHSWGEHDGLSSQADAAHSRRRAPSPVGAWTSGVVALSASSSRSDGPVGQAGGRAAGKQVAIMALARKLAHVLYALWKHGTTYDPARGARPIAA